VRRGYAQLASTLSDLRNPRYIYRPTWGGAGGTRAGGSGPSGFRTAAPCFGSRSVSPSHPGLLRRTETISVGGVSFRAPMRMSQQTGGFQKWPPFGGPIAHRRLPGLVPIAKNSTSDAASAFRTKPLEPACAGIPEAEATAMNWSGRILDIQKRR
jgi:hypothetical protein